jgi:hypothetical protein
LDYLLREFIGLVFNNERDEKTIPFWNQMWEKMSKRARCCGPYFRLHQCHYNDLVLRLRKVTH